MGGQFYSSVSRAVRSENMGYTTKPLNEVFTQQREQKAHKDMLPENVAFREARDSDVHPNTVPIQLYLDVTGSMGHIPHHLIKEGLPKLISNLIQRGVPDVALMFGAVGDHECDDYPLQISQFESGDEELDMWLTRTYLEGGGGGNYGESYALAWYFSAFHTQTDAFDKRGKKGFVFTIGDEPNLKNYPKSAIKSIMGGACAVQDNMSAAELYSLASERNHVFHINLEHGYARKLNPDWVQLMGDNAINISEYQDLPQVIADTVLKTMGQVDSSIQPANDSVVENENEPEEMIL